MATRLRRYPGDAVLKVETKRRFPRPGFLSRLRSYSANEVAANNKYRQLFSQMPSWSLWVDDVLQELLQVPGGNELAVTLMNDLDSENTKSFVFTQKEVSIGRGAENDLPLQLQSISRRHARIFERDGEYFIEDLRSSGGTYVNRRKLDPEHPCPLRDGDEVLIFPYALRLSPRDLWSRDEEVRLSYSSALTTLKAAEFASGSGAGMCMFHISIHPEMGQILLEISRPLVQTILLRLLRSREVDLVETDRELLEFIASCVLEKANSALKYPFECSLNSLGSEMQSSETGLKLEVLVQLSEAHGCIRLFLPGSFLEKSPKGESFLPKHLKTAITWRLSLRIGLAEIETAELNRIEEGDILVYASNCELVLPAAGRGAAQERGWRVVRDESNACRFLIEDFHEWSYGMPEEERQDEAQEKTSAANLTALPVRLHVVLGHVDMNLKGLESLVEGSIVELDGENHGTVQLVAGETVLGSGELVELEDHRLGVQVTRWREQ
jgi:type III secretion system YscQ/HrcQ family protein